MNPSSPVRPLDGLELPPRDGLTEQQARGAACIWDGTPVTTTTAIDFGEQQAADGTHWFPRACRPCTLPRAMQALQYHSGMCEPCVDDFAQCPTGLALVRLVREARR